jgi:LmbE family N-acetylglucosaminyl deacetylase
MKKRMVAMFAHPDDESFGPAGTLALLSKDYDIHLITATRGEAGENHREDAGTRPLAEVRTEEVRTAAQALGIQNVHILNFPDSGLCNTLFGTVLKETEQICKLVKPEKIITFEPKGLTGHMDHIFMTNIATSVFNRNSAIQSILYHHFERSVQEHMQDYYKSKGFDVLFPQGLTAREAHLKVNISSVRQQKQQAMKSHRSQQGDYHAYDTAFKTSDLELFTVQSR